MNLTLCLALCAYRGSSAKLSIFQTLLTRIRFMMTLASPFSKMALFVYLTLRVDLPSDPEDCRGWTEPSPEMYVPKAVFELSRVV